MLSFYVSRGVVLLRIRKQIKGVKHQIDYYQGLTSDLFSASSQRYQGANSILNLRHIDLEKYASEILLEYGIENLTTDTFRGLMDDKQNNGVNSFYSFARK